MSGGGESVKSRRVDWVLVEEGREVRSPAGWPAFRGRSAKLGYRSAREAEERRVVVLAVIVERGMEVPDLRVYERTQEMVRSRTRREHFELRRNMVPVPAAQLAGEGEGAVAVEQTAAEARTLRAVRR